MGLHVEQQILNAVQALLIAAAAQTEAGDDVYVDRLDPLPKGKRRAILIREGENGDTIQAATVSRFQQRDLEVEILPVVRLCDDAVAEARAFGLVVEKILSPNNATLRALCKQGWRITGSRPVQSGEGEEATAGRLQTWTFTSIVPKATPDVVA